MINNMTLLFWWPKYMYWLYHWKLSSICRTQGLLSFIVFKMQSISFYCFEVNGCSNKVHRKYFYFFFFCVLSKLKEKERASNESRSLKLYSNWQLPAVFEEHRRHMYTFINIKRRKKRRKLRTNHSYVNTNEEKGVMPFIENSNIYIV
jgi:hypothetical protein